MTMRTFGKQPVGAGLRGGLDPKMAEAIAQLMNSRTGGTPMMGPSMATGVGQAGSPGMPSPIAGVGGVGAQGGAALAGAAGMGPMQSALGGPLGGVMGGMLNMGMAQNDKIDRGIAQLQGMPSFQVKRNHWGDIGATIDELMGHGMHGVGGTGGVMGGTQQKPIGAQGPAPGNPAAPRDGQGMEFPESPQLSHPPMMGLETPSPRDALQFSPDEVGRSMGPSPRDAALDASATAQLSALDMGNAMKAPLQGAGPAVGLAEALRGAAAPPIPTSPGMRGGPAGFPGASPSEDMWPRDGGSADAPALSLADRLGPRTSGLMPPRGTRVDSMGQVHGNAAMGTPRGSLTNPTALEPFSQYEASKRQARYGGVGRR